MLYTYDDCVKQYKTKYGVKKAVESGELYRLEKGIYSDKQYVSGDLIIAKRYPNAVLTLDSAFYHYHLTDVVPEKYYLATNRDAAKIRDKRVVQVFERADLLELGVTTETREKCVLTIYSKERMLVELLRHKSRLPFDYYKEILLNFREQIYEMDIRAVQDYAEAVPKSAMVMETLRLEVL